MDCAIQYCTIDFSRANIFSDNFCDMYHTVLTVQLFYVRYPQVGRLLGR